MCRVLAPYHGPLDDGRAHADLLTGRSRWGTAANGTGPVPTGLHLSVLLDDRTACTAASRTAVLTLTSSGVDVVASTDLSPDNHRTDA